jgi:hypothetical protein
MVRQIAQLRQAGSAPQRAMNFPLTSARRFQRMRLTPALRGIVTEFRLRYA